MNDMIKVGLELIEQFDYAKTARIMCLLETRWRGSESSPTQSEIRQTVESLVHRVTSNFEMVNEPTNTGTGGINVYIFNFNGTYKMKIAYEPVNSRNY